MKHLIESCSIVTAFLCTKKKKVGKHVTASFMPLTPYPARSLLVMR